MTKRSLIVRVSGLVVVAVLSVYLFSVGKGHTIYLDTNAVILDGIECSAPDMSTVTVNSLPGEDMGRAERVIIKVAGPDHVIKVASLSGDEKKWERKVNIPTFLTEVIISVPAIVAGAPDGAVIYPFVAPPRIEEPTQQTVQQEESDVIKLEPAKTP